MRPSLVSLLALIVTLACSETPLAPEPEVRELSAHGGPPTVIVITVVLPGQVDPCTGNEHTVTIVNTVSIHTVQNNTVLRADRVTTTDDGYEGRGHATLVTNNNVATFLLSDILTHPDGRKFHVRGTSIFDLRTMTFKVGPGPFFACIRG